MVVAEHNPMISLSFNQKLVAASDIDRAIQSRAPQSIDCTKPIPLRSSWSLWEQLQQAQSAISTPDQQAAPLLNVTANYGDLTRKVASVSDVQSFWRYYSHLPQPSAILGESMKVVRQESEDGPIHTLAALMLFRGDIRPEWEDPANRKGGHFQFTLQLERTRSNKDAPPAGKSDSAHTSWMAQTDEYWNNLVLGLIGETLEPSDFVTGVRLVDKVKLPIKPGSRAVGHIRIEIWFRDASDKAKIHLLEESVESHLKNRLDGSISSEVFPGYRLDMRTHEETGNHPGEGEKSAAARGLKKNNSNVTGARKVRKSSVDEHDNSTADIEK